MRAAVTALLLAAAAVAVPADALWDRAVASILAGDHLVPGTVLTRTEERTPDGKLRSTRETSVRVRVIDGELTYDLMRDVQDGQVVDAGDADGTTGASATRISEAFEADLSAVSATRDGERRTIRGRRAIGYRIELPAEQYTLKGQVWLSEQGVPLELQYTVDPLPRTVQGVSILADYDLEDGRAVISRIVTQVAISVSIFYRRLYTISVRLDDYFDPDA